MEDELLSTSGAIAKYCHDTLEIGSQQWFAGWNPPQHAHAAGYFAQAKQSACQIFPLRECYCRDFHQYRLALYGTEENETRAGA